MRKSYILVLIALLISCNHQKGVDYKKETTLVLPGVVNTELFEMNSSYSKSGNEFYYSIADPYQNFNAIVLVKKQNGSWNTPEVVNFSGQFSDFDPFVTPDGNRLYFCSRRPLSNRDTSVGDANIWYVERDGNEWNNPQALHKSINSEYDEYYVSVSKRGFIFFSST